MTTNRNAPLQKFKVKNVFEDLPVSEAQDMNSPH